MDLGVSHFGYRMWSVSFKTELWMNTTPQTDRQPYSAAVRDDGRHLITEGPRGCVSALVMHNCSPSFDSRQAVIVTFLCKSFSRQQLLLARCPPIWAPRYLLPSSAVILICHSYQTENKSTNHDDVFSRSLIHAKVCQQRYVRIHSRGSDGNCVESHVLWASLMRKRKSSKDKP